MSMKTHTYTEYLITCDECGYNDGLPWSVKHAAVRDWRASGGSYNDKTGAATCDLCKEDRAYRSKDATRIVGRYSGRPAMPTGLRARG